MVQWSQSVWRRTGSRGWGGCNGLAGNTTSCLNPSPVRSVEEGEDGRLGGPRWRASGVPSSTVPSRPRSRGRPSRNPRQKTLSVVARLSAVTGHPLRLLPGDGSPVGGLSGSGARTESAGGREDARFVRRQGRPLPGAGRSEGRHGAEGRAGKRRGTLLRSAT